MNFSLDQQILYGFQEWFEHTLLKEGRAFFNITGGTLYSGTDPKYNVVTYSSPYYQWVYDNSISGAYVPTTGSWNVPVIDYKNGRTFLSQPTGTINYSVKEFNIYTSSNTDMDLIYEGKYFRKPTPNSRTASGSVPYNVAVPCIFLIPENQESLEIQLGGGIIEKTVKMSAFVVSDNEYNRYSVGSIFSEKLNTYFPYFNDTIFNEYGGLKSGSYNYVSRASSANGQNLCYIKGVKFTPLEHDLITRNHPNLYFGKIYFHLCYNKNVNRNLIT